MTSEGTFQVQLLGPLAVQRDGLSLPVSSWRPRARTLFLLLLTAPHHRRSREELIDLLWPDAAPESGSQNLRFFLHALRRSLAEGLTDRTAPSPLLSEQGWVALNPAYRWEVDLERFEQLLREGREDREGLREAAALYRGEPLAEERYEDWAVPVRERIRRQWRELCLRLAGLAREGGALAEAAGWLERVLAEDPVDEEVGRELVGVLAAQGKRVEALRRYGELERALAEELGVGPMPETVAVVARLKQTEPAVVPVPLPVVAPPPPQEVEVAPSYPLPITTRLVGRDDVINRICESLPDRPGGPPRRFLLLEAEAGMGKTRVLAEAARIARDRVIMVLAGGCYEQEGRLPYGPIHDALLDYVRAQPPERLEQELEGLMPEIARLLPEIRERIPGIQEAQIADREEQRLRLFWALARALERISGRRPLVLLLDDLQWADDTTLHLIHYLLRQPGLDRLLLVGAYRKEEAPEGSPLARLGAEEGSTILRLQPLRREDLAELLAQRTPLAPSLVRELHERSGGNPFFAREILELLLQDGYLLPGVEGMELTQGADIGLPVAVRDMVARRLRQFGSETREVLDASAVLGREFAYGPLEALWEGSERDLFRALDDVLDALVLEETETGYAFRHPLSREVVYDRMQARRRARLHERAGLVLEESYGEHVAEHAAELAHHFVAAGRGQDARAYRYLLLAARAASLAYSWKEALALYQSALERASGEVERAEVREQMGATLTALGRLDDALASLEVAAGLYRATGDLEGEARVTAQIVDRQFLFRGAVEGLQRLPPLMKKLEERGPSRALVTLHLTYGRIASSTQHASLTVMEDASLLARKVGDDKLLSAAEVWRSMFLMAHNRSEEARQVIEDIAPVMKEVGNQSGLSVAFALPGEILKLAGKFEESLMWRRRNLEQAQQHGDPLWLVPAHATLGETLFLLGDWRTARTHLEEADKISGQLGSPWHAAFPRLGLGVLNLAEGRIAEASELIEACLADAERLNHRNWVQNAQRLLTRRDLQTGQTEEALARLASLQSLEPPDGTPGTLWIQAWAELERGDLDAAEDAARQGIERSRTQNNRLDELEALIVLGRAAAARSRWEEAERTFEEALSLATGMPYPHARARIIHHQAMLLTAQGKPNESRDRMREAVEIFEAVGAPNDLYSRSGH